MSKLERGQRRITWIGIILFFGIIIFGRNINRLNFKAPEEKNKEAVHLPYKTLYKTIPDPENAIGLIGYELHEDGQYTDGSTTRATFSAVVKSLDSQKDDYKALCRNIIADVIQTCGDKQVQVNIYDSFEAYSLAALYEQQYKPLSKEQEDTINKHRVAVYEYASVYEGEYANLTFYPDAANGLQENEVYNE